MDDIALNKVAVIERCSERVREVYAGDAANLYHDLTRQDSIVLNLQRACEAAIDLAMHWVRVARLGVPQESRGAFQLLVDAHLLDAELAVRLQRMVGFRNVAVHNYQSLNLDIVKHVVETELDDVLTFARLAFKMLALG